MMATIITQTPATIAVEVEIQKYVEMANSNPIICNCAMMEIIDLSMGVINAILSQAGNALMSYS